MTRKFRGGAYATIVSIIMIVIVIIVNLVFTKLNITFDMTEDGKYSLTEETITMLGELEDEITFYYLVTDGASIELFDKILSQYTKYGKNITLVQKDTVLNPTFASKYTSEDVEEFSVIVVNETTGRSRYVPYSDMLIVETGIDYTTYQYYNNITGIDMEGQLNSAIGYVTTDHLPTLYEASGHGMQQLGTEAISLLKKANIVVNTGDNSLELLTISHIPEDCDVLLIHTPQTDFTEDEVALLSDFMQQGGNLIFVLSYLNTEHPNLLGLVSSYGIQLEDGIVLEEETRNYMQYPYILLSNIVSHELTSDIYQTKYVVGQNSSGLTLLEHGSNLITEGFLKTSDSAYLKSENASSYFKEEGDPTGVYYIGVYAEDSETNAKMTVFSSPYIFNDVYASGSAFGNLNLLVNCVNTLAEVEETTTAVRTVSLIEEDYLVVTEAQGNLIALLVVILLPVSILAVGIIWVVYRRKHS